MEFLDYYFENRTFYMPIDFDLCSVNELGEIKIGIPLKYLPQLVEYDVIRLSRNGKVFKSLEEAYQYVDSLTEEETDNDEEDTQSLRTKIVDPETGTEREFEVAAGNAKIGSDTVILNMSTAGNCMSAIIGTCKLGPGGKCYALTFEKQWKSAHQKNIRHEQQWACLTPKAIAMGIDKITKVLPSVKYVRINEAGEFRNLPSNPELLNKVSDEKKAQLANVDDVAKLKFVGEELLKLGSKLMLYTYTHRSDLDIGDLGPNICINGSGYMIDNAFIPLPVDDFKQIIDLVNRKELKEFNGVPIKHGLHCMGDCRVCWYCKRKQKNHIFIPIHGPRSSIRTNINKVVKSVVNQPEFNEIYHSTATLQEKGERSLQLVPEDIKKTFNLLVPVRQDRVDLFKTVIQDLDNTERLAKALEKYVEKGLVKDGSMNMVVSDEASAEALSNSVDALMGKFKDAIERAKSEGQETAANKKWGPLIRELQQAIEKTQKGEKPKITKKLASQHAGIFKKIQKGLNI